MLWLLIFFLTDAYDDVTFGILICCCFRFWCRSARYFHIGSCIRLFVGILVLCSDDWYYWSYFRLVLVIFGGVPLVACCCATSRCMCLVVFSFSCDWQVCIRIVVLMTLHYVFLWLLVLLLLILVAIYLSIATAVAYRCLPRQGLCVHSFLLLTQWSWMLVFMSLLVFRDSHSSSFGSGVWCHVLVDSLLLLGVDWFQLVWCSCCFLLFIGLLYFVVVCAGLPFSVSSSILIDQPCVVWVLHVRGLDVQHRLFMHIPQVIAHSLLHICLQFLADIMVLPSRGWAYHRLLCALSPGVRLTCRRPMAPRSIERHSNWFSIYFAFSGLGSLICTVSFRWFVTYLNGPSGRYHVARAMLW